MYKMLSLLLMSLLVMHVTAAGDNNCNMSVPIKVKENENISTTIQTVYVNGTNPKIFVNITHLVEVRNNPACNGAVCNLFDLVTKKVFDREGTNGGYVNFKYSCSNHSKLYSNYLVILDKNDNEPVFENQPYRATIPENFTVNSFIPHLEIKATDNDENPHLNYTLEPSGQNSEGIQDFMAIRNPYNGSITVIKQLDYETRNFFEYTVSVTDGLHITNASVWIQIEDIQDMPPVFTDSNFVKRINENSPNGTVVMTVTAVDQDRGIPNPIGYEIVDDSCSLFSISNISGRVRLISNIDRENALIVNESGVCTLKIKAYENVIGDSTNKSITIFIEDLNDNIPFFNKDFYNATVSESASIDNPVTVSEAITVKDKDTAKFSKFKLSLTTLDNQPFTTLKISPIEAVSETNLALSVVNTEELDYETTKHIEFKIVATDIHSNISSEANVTLKILPVNEFTPNFTESAYQINVNEEEKVDNLITVTATDLDYGKDGEVTYALIGEAFFTINKTTGTISVVSELDYEKRTSHTLIVEATDGGNRKATANLNVFVIDINDNYPVFKPTSYTGRLKEGEIKFEYEIIVTATDADEVKTNNSEVKYSLVNVTQGLLSNFSINEQNGKITPSKIDFENLTENVIQLVVKAADNGNPTRESFTHVNITVLDVNDNAPIFQLSSYNISVKENATADSFLLNISAIDEDKTSPFNQVTYRLNSHTSIFRINSADGSILIISKLNREDTPFYTLEIEAIDGGSPPRSSKTEVNVTVEDVNDEVPKLEVADNKIELYENITVGSFITSINATDEDLDSNLIFNISQETIEIDGKGRESNKKTTMSYFSINSTTGDITLKEILDREKFERILLNVEVSDQNTVEEAKKTAKEYLRIKILDINDCYPVFRENFTSLSLSENYPNGSLIATLTATDDDKDDVVTYEIHGSLNIFSINNETGEIFLISRLDREEEPNITFYVVASDSGLPTLSSTATVSVIVKDFNDNAPEFQNPESSLSISENTTVNSTITTINATDKDIGIHASIIYRLRVLDENSPFKIDNKTGDIILISKLDREDVDKYTVVITASDNYDHEIPFEYDGWKKNTTTIFITITDVNDNPPEFKPDKYYVRVAESKTPGNTLITVTTIDKDIGENGQFNYTLQGNESSFFDINTDTGVISVLKNLTNEVGIKEFNVTATDKGNPRLNSTAIVSVTVTDVNNNRPIFITPNHSVSIPESTCPGTTIYTVSATDDDYGVNKKIKYALKTTTKHFKIDNDGNVSLIERLDYENREEHQIEIKASDYGVPSLGTTFLLVVNVTNDDDEPPEFAKTNKSASFHINEGPPPTFVGTVEARDKELGFESCYTIVDNTEDYFIVKNESGVASIETKKEIDYEKTKSLKLVVVVNNCNSSTNNTSCPNSPSSRDINNKQNVIVFIKDIDDNPPRFIEKTFYEAMMFDFPSNVAVIDFANYVTDADTDHVNKRHTYFIESFNFDNDALKQFKTPFEMKNSGVQRIADFDSSVSGYIGMSIKVNDSNGRFDTASLKVYVISKNDKVEIVFGKPIEEVRARKMEFIRFLQAIIGDEYKVIPGIVDVHKNDNGEVDSLRTDMFVYAINSQTKKVVPAKELLELLDMKRALNEEAFLKFDVEKVQEPVPPEIDSSFEKSLVILVAVIVLLTFILIVIILLFCRSVRRYNRKLRAAETNTKPQNIADTQYPGANMFSDGVVNPLFNNLDENEMVGPLPEKESLNSIYNNNDVSTYPENIPDDNISYSMPADNSRLDLENVIKERDAELNNNSMNPSDHLNLYQEVDIESADV